MSSTNKTKELVQLTKLNKYSNFKTGLSDIMDIIEQFTNDKLSSHDAKHQFLQKFACLSHDVLQTLDSVPKSNLNDLSK